MNRREFVEAVGALTLAAGSGAASAGKMSSGLAGELHAHQGPEQEFTPVERSIAELSRAQVEGRASAESLTQAYLQRIDRYDRQGPKLGAVLAVNPDALAAARALDAARRSRKLLGPLHGIPILIKDNIETRDPLPTTAGSLALAGARHAEDAPVAARLRAAGAVVLGKANLSEWANFRSSRSVSGWSAVGGQTRCPYDPTRNPSGSSAGPAAGTAANLCAAAVGSETDGSVLAPASINGLVGVKPTVGLVSGVGVVPITTRQDTTGPMTRSVADAALLLSVMADPAVRWDGVGSLDSLPAGLRLGVLPPPASTHPQVLSQSQDWFKLLQREGLTLVDVASPPGWPALLDDEFEVLLYDFKADLNAYLARFNGTLPVRTLADLIEFNRQHAAAEMPFFGQELFEQSEERGPRTSPAYQKALRHITEVADTNGLAAIFARYRVDALVASGNGPAELIDHVWGDHYENSGGWPPMCSAAAIAGYPSLTVPAGFVDGLPVGIHFVAPRFRDGLLLRIGRRFERARNARQPPKLDAPNA
jgi:amidase